MGNTITIRTYRDDDAASVGRLIARTYSAFNLGFATPDQQASLLGPFRFSESTEPDHRVAIARALEAPVVLVAEEPGAIVGVLRGGRLDGKGRGVLQSLFVARDRQRQGIGRRLVAHFEQACRARGITVVGLSSTLYAVPFYQALAYKRSTGVRTGRSFQGSGLPYQPMKKTLT